MGNVNAKEDGSRVAGTLRALRHGSLDSSSNPDGSKSQPRRLRAYTSPSPGPDRDHHSSSSSSKRKSKDKRHAQPLQPPAPDQNDMVDGGYMAPHGVYSGPISYSYKIVRQLIIERRVAPYFKGLEDYDQDWSDRQLLAALRGFPLQPEQQLPGSEADPDGQVDPVDPATVAGVTGLNGAGVAGPNQQSRPIQVVEDYFEDGTSVSPNVSVPTHDDAQSVSQSVSAQSDTPVTSISSGGSKPDLADPDASPAVASELQPDPVQPEHAESSAAAAAAADSQLSATPASLPSPSAPSVSRPNSHSDSSSIEDDADLQHIYDMKEESQHLEFGSSTEPGSPINSGGASTLEKTEEPLYRRARANTEGNLGRPSGRDHEPHDVPAEVKLYEGATECPICFLYYPKYLNYTRCCGQLICTECFVQIKRPDPHKPYSNSEPGSEVSTPAESPQTEQLLVSEPACCPYCTAPEFGVVYIPAPVRSGLPLPGKSFAYALLHSGKSSPNRSGVSIAGSGSGLGSGAGTKKEQFEDERSQFQHRGSIPPSAPEVITTDQIRPDWSTKLESARQHLARRSAAANALHATAFMMAGTTTTTTNTSSRSSHRKRKGSRLRALTSSSNSSNSTLHSQGAAATAAAATTSASAGSTIVTASSSSPGRHVDPLTNHSSRRRSRLRDLEDTMLSEAIRRSLQIENNGPRIEVTPSKKDAGPGKGAASHAESPDSSARTKGKDPVYHRSSADNSPIQPTHQTSISISSD